mmetsp:Transcript_4366/g.14308  ORF Transcript_4366/g.14308 Transcript_4366/m.14308 type:complete len:268 (-) Transcript_4366:699-1502(-)
MASLTTSAYAPPETSTNSANKLSRSASVSLERNPALSMSSSGAPGARGNALNKLINLLSSSMTSTESLLRMAAPAWTSAPLTRTAADAVTTETHFAGVSAKSSHKPTRNGPTGVLNELSAPDCPRKASSTANSAAARNTASRALSGPTDVAAAPPLPAAAHALRKSAILSGENPAPPTRFCASLAPCTRANFTKSSARPGGTYCGVGSIHQSGNAFAAAFAFAAAAAAAVAFIFAAFDAPPPGASSSALSNRRIESRLAAVSYGTQT